MTPHWVCPSTTTSRVLYRSAELDAADLGRRHDVSSDADDKQVAEALVEDDLGRHARIGTTEDDGERLLPRGQLAPARLTGGCVAALTVGDEAPVPLSEAFECVSCRDHRSFIAMS